MEKPLHATASFWLTTGGVALRALRRRRAAGLALLVASVGYGAIVLERLTGDDVRALPAALRTYQFDVEQWCAHLALGALGYRWFTER